MSSGLSISAKSSGDPIGPSTPKSTKPRPTPMAFSNFGGADPFPSCGSPYTEDLTRTGKLATTVFNSLGLADEEATEEKVDLAGSKRRPQMALELDESVTAGGADPMPSWETKRTPGGEPNPWEDEDFDPTHEGVFENFDDEDEHQEVVKLAKSTQDPDTA